MSSSSSYTLSLDDVRDYLIDTNAIKDAELFLIQSKREEEREKELNVKRANAKNSKDVSIDSVRNRVAKKNSQLHRDDLLNSLVAEKHAGRLGVMREEEEIRELRSLEIKLRDQNFAMERERMNIAAEVQKAKRSQLDVIEKQAEQDLLALESQRQQTLNEMSKKQGMLEALKLDLRKAEAEIEEASQRPTATNASVRLAAEANTPAERMRAVKELTAEHAQRLAKTRAEGMSAAEELRRLDEGLWKYTVDKDKGVGESKEGNSSGNGNTNSNASLRSQSNLPSGIQEIIDSVTSSDGLRDQQKRLDALRKEAAQEARELDFDFDGVGEMRGGDVPDVLGRKDGSLRDCLDEWLGVEVGKSATVVPESEVQRQAQQAAPSSSSSSGSRRGSTQQAPSQQSLRPGPAGQPMEAVAAVDASTNELITTLQDEIRKLKEDQARQQQQQQQNPYQQQQPGQPFFNPMAHMGMAGMAQMGAYGAAGYSPMNPMFPVPPPPMQYPQPYFNPYQQQQQQQADPAQQLLVQQIQKMADQMERENQRLMGQLRGGGQQLYDGPPDFVGGVGQDGGGLGDRQRLRSRLANGSQSDSNAAKPRRADNVSRIEQKYQDDIRLMQLEHERLKQQQELEEFKYQLDKQKAQRAAEDEHNEWLRKQKQDLQVIKMKQALAKEQRLLQAQTGEESGGFVNNFPDAPGGAGGSESPEKRKNASMLLEEAGCGGTKIPLDLSKGASVLADGVLMAPENQKDDQFRLAIGIYDAKGKLISPLKASRWQAWSDVKGDRANFNFVPAASAQQSVVAPKDGGESLLVPGVRALVELQAKSTTGPQSSAGWAVLPLVFEEPTGARFVNRGLWRLCIRKGDSNAACDLAVIPEDPLPGWILLRVGDFGEIGTQKAFDPKTYMGFKTENDVLQSYVDPLVPPDVFPDGAVENPRQTPQLRSRPPSSSDPAQNNKKPEGRGSRPATGLSAIEEESAAADDDYKGPVKSRVDDKAAWIMGTPPGPATEKYQRGDGIDIYIDSALFLPDNCTVTRLVLKIFSADKEMIGAPYEIISPPLTLAKSPVYKFKAELRGAVLNTTATALVRVDTLDCNSLLSVSVGYACFKLFCSQDTREQPKTSNDGACFINTGAFQVPIHGGRMTQMETFNDKMLSGMTRIPCSSVLVRIVTAPRSADGLAVLSRDDFVREDWVKMGLDIPAPLYASGAYHGLLCAPSDIEKICYTAKAEVAASVDAAVSQAISSRTELPPPVTPKPSGGHEGDLRAWLASLLLPATEMRRTIDMSFAVPYSLDAGVSVSVDMLYGMPEAAGGMFAAAPTNVFKVIYSIVPPGLFYKDPPLSEGVRFTKTEDYSKPAKHPVFLDGFCEFSPSQLDENVYLILDVRTVRIDPPRTKQSDTLPIVVEPPVLEKSYWAMLPLAKERTPGQGFRYVASGTFQVPLVKGPVPGPDVFSSEAPLQAFFDMLGSRSKSGLKLAEGASIIVRIVNPLLKNMFENDFAGKPPDAPSNILSGPGSYFRRLIDVAASGSTGGAIARLEKYVFDIGKANTGKSVLMLLPRDQDAKKLAKVISKDFATKMGINIDT